MGKSLAPCFWTHNVGQLSLASLWGRLVEYQLGWGNGGNVSSAMCDPMWHVSSRMVLLDCLTTA